MEKSDSQIHYEELRKFFENLIKYTLLALGIIIGAGTYFLYSSVTDIKSEISEATKAMQNNAKESINSTREITSNKIETIREEASMLAKNEAQKKIDESFRTENINRMIETAAEHQIGQEINNMITKEINRITPTIQSDLSEIGNISDMAMRMRIGLRSGYEDLIKICSSSNSEITRKFSSKILSRITDDYDSVNTKNLQTYYGNNILDTKVMFGLTDKDNDIAFVKKLISTIETDIDLDKVSLSFIILRKLTKKNIMMFDFNAIKNLKKEY